MRNSKIAQLAACRFRRTFRIERFHRILSPIRYGSKRNQASIEIKGTGCSISIGYQSLELVDSDNLDEFLCGEEPESESVGT